MDYQSYKPTHKVTAAGAAGAAAAIVAWLLAVTTGVQMPPGIEAAFATLFAFAAGWLVREGGGTGHD